MSSVGSAIKFIIAAGASFAVGFFIGKTYSQKKLEEIHEKEIDDVRNLYIHSGKYIRKTEMDIPKEESKPVYENRPGEKIEKTKAKREKVDYTTFFKKHEEDGTPMVKMKYEEITEYDFGSLYDHSTESIEVYRDFVFTDATTGEVFTADEVIEYIGQSTYDDIIEHLEEDNIDEVWYVRNNAISIDYEIYIKDEEYNKEE